MNLAFNTSIMETYYHNMRHHNFWASEERQKKEEQENDLKKEDNRNNNQPFYHRNPKNWDAEFKRLKELLDELREITNLSFFRRGYFFDILV